MAGNITDLEPLRNMTLGSNGKCIQFIIKSPEKNTPARDNDDIHYNLNGDEKFRFKLKPQTNLCWPGTLIRTYHFVWRW